MSITITFSVKAYEKVFVQMDDICSILKRQAQKRDEERVLRRNVETNAKKQEEIGA